MADNVRQFLREALHGALDSIEDLNHARVQASDLPAPPSTVAGVEGIYGVEADASGAWVGYEARFYVIGYVKVEADTENAGLVDDELDRWLDLVVTTLRGYDWEGLGGEEFSSYTLEGITGVRIDQQVPAPDYTANDGSFMVRGALMFTQSE